MRVYFYLVVLCMKELSETANEQVSLPCNKYGYSRNVGKEDNKYTPEGSLPIKVVTSRCLTRNVC